MPEWWKEPARLRAFTGEVVEMPRRERRDDGIRPVGLSFGQRFACVTFGLAVIGLAQAGVYLGHDGAAVVALVVLAGVAFLLGVVGLVPKRVSWGKSLKLEFLAGVRVAEAQALTTAPSEISRLAQEAIATVKGSADVEGVTEAVILADHALFTAEIMAVVKDVAAMIGAETKENGIGDEWWNARVAKGSVSVYVSIRTTLDDQVTSYMRSRMSAVEEGADVLIVAREVDTRALRNLGGPRPPAVITWQGEPDDLKRPLARLFKNRGRSRG
ncbi:hypothetical protein ACFQ73_09725 [Amycolatopsis japonica]|uniref:hypothetical protein n=1 Tax=Amycolatopsis japonica TaxID=208439 RepID=UPI00366F2F79